MLEHLHLAVRRGELFGEFFDLVVLVINNLSSFSKPCIHKEIYSREKIILQQLPFKNVPFIHFFRHHSFKEKGKLEPVDTAIISTV